MGGPCIAGGGVSTRMNELLMGVSWRDWLVESCKARMTGSLFRASHALRLSMNAISLSCGALTKGSPWPPTRWYTINPCITLSSANAQHALPSDRTQKHERQTFSVLSLTTLNLFWSTRSCRGCQELRYSSGKMIPRRRGPVPSGGRSARAGPIHSWTSVREGECFD